MFSHVSYNFFLTRMSRRSQFALESPFKASTIFCLQTRYDLSKRRPICRVPFIDHHTFIICPYYLCDISPRAVFHGLDVELASAGGFAISVNPIPTPIRRPSPSTQIIYHDIIEIFLNRGIILLSLLVFLARLFI